jgi:predicted Zn-dependent protease
MVGRMVDVNRRRRSMTTAARRLFVVGLVLVLAGCATGRYGPRPSLRDATDDEKRQIGPVLAPLMAALDYQNVRPAAVAPSAPRCSIPLGILRSPTINAGVSPGRAEPCVHFSLLITEGALGTLSSPELQALLAHELGHVHLGHFARAKDRRRVKETWSRRSTTLADTLGAIPIIGAPMLAALVGVEVVSSGIYTARMRAFSREDETEADRFAVNLLRRLGGGDACLNLAAMLDRLSEGSQSRAAEWRSTHPSPERRAERVRTECRAS